MFASAGLVGLPACLLLYLLLISGCAGVGLAPLQPGVASEAEVRARMGEPGRVWPALPEVPGVARVLEYSRQPYGHTTHMADIAPDGKLLALRQVLTNDNFANVKVGLARDAVLRMLGKPLAITHYRLKDQTHYDWRYRDGNNWSDSRVFTAVFGADLRVVSTGSIPDPDLDPKVDPYVLQTPSLRFAWRGFGGPGFGLR